MRSSILIMATPQKWEVKGGKVGPSHMGKYLL